MCKRNINFMDREEIYIIVYNGTKSEEDSAFKQQLMRTFENGAVIHSGVYLISLPNANVYEIMNKMSPFAKGSLFVAPLDIPYCTRGFAKGLDEWFERHGKKKIKQTEFKKFMEWKKRNQM